MPDHDALLSIGGNLGDRDAAVASVVDTLRADGRVSETTLSPLYATPAIGGPPEQPDFLNAALRLRFNGHASELLTLVGQMETSAQRRRTTRWAARTLDVDVILFGCADRDTRTLAIPHPRYASRRFVLVPSADVAADMVDPRTGWTIAETLRHLDAALPSMRITGGSVETRRRIVDAVEERSVDAGRPIPVLRDDEPIIGESDDPKGRIVVRLRSLEDRHEHWWCDAISGPAAGPHDGNATDPADPESLRRRLDWPPMTRLYRGRRERPEYDLDPSDLRWAADELTAAMRSMVCPCRRIDAGPTSAEPQT